MTGDHSVTKDLVVLHAEVRAAVRHEAIKLDEGALIHEEVDALSRGELALLMLGGDACLAATNEGGFAHLTQSFYGSLSHGVLIGIRERLLASR